MEYLTRNSLEFFIQNVLPDARSIVRNKQMTASLKKIYPHLTYEAGTDHFAQINPNRYETKLFPSFRNFDEVLNRSFIEVCLVAVFFSETPQLQNEQIKVAYFDT